MKLTVLGRSTAVPNPGEACAGYLVTADETRLLVDIGPGVVAQLLRIHRPTDLTAVVISHMHPDHLFDLVTLRYAFPWIERPRPRLPVIMPPGSREQLIDLARGAGDAEFFESTFEIREHDGQSDLAFGPFQLRPIETQHYVPTWGFRVVERERTLAYSADSGPCDALLDLARNAELFLCEAALLAPDDDPQPQRRGHLTAREAGEAARTAGAGRLLLTHLNVTDGQAERAAGDAAVAFGDGADVAEPQRVYDI